MRVRTYCFPGCFTRPPGTSTRNHPCETTTSKPVVPRGFLYVTAFYRPGARRSPRAGDGTCWRTSALTKTTRPRATWGALRHFVSVRSLRGFRAAGLATPGPRSLRLGSASRGNLGRRPTAVKRPRATKPHSPEISRQAPARSAILAADADHRAPRAALLAPVGPRAVRAAQRRSRGRALPQRRRAVDARRRATSCSTPSRPTGSSAASACGALPRARTPTAAWASSAWPCRRSCRGAARGRGRLAPGAPGVGTRAGDRGRARVAAPRLRGARTSRR